MSTGSNSNSAQGTSIEAEHYYHGLLPREDVRLLLKENGDFLVRMSEPKSGETRTFILSVLIDKNADETSAMKHLIIHTVGEKVHIEHKTQFDCIQMLIEHYVAQRDEAIVKIVNPVSRQPWELEHEQIVLQRKLGEGAFGEVSMGLFKATKRSKGVQVAVKQAKLEKMGKEQIKEFMSEARHLRTLNHPHIVKFYGVAVLQEPLYMVMELVPLGSLVSYLHKNPKLSTEKLTELALQASWGIEYLHSMTILHRDIAARNCLYGDQRVRISDFGLSRQGVSYQMEQSKKVPIRWLALETLQTFIYTQKTDVWAFGIMCWEIYQKGIEPYPGMSAAEANQKVRQGHRMQVPSGVPGEVAKMIESCWLEKPADRPTMVEVAAVLQKAAGCHRPNFGETPKDSNKDTGKGKKGNTKKKKRKGEK